MASPQSRRALVVYGSETGNARDIAEELGRLAERLRFDAEVAELNAVALKQLLQHSVVLIAISTTGQGELPANSQTFWRALRSARLRPGCLQQVRFASFGLGDSSYPKFNWAHRKLYNRIVQLGAHPVCDRGESDEQHPDGVDGTFLPWSTNLRHRLLQEYPLPQGTEPIPDNVLLDPKWLLDFTSECDHASASEAATSPETVADAPPGDLINIAGGLVAQVKTNQRLTPEKHWQDVRHLTLHLSGRHPYAPGDVLTIYPKNFPQDVSQFITLMGWTSVADKPLKLVPKSPSTARLPIPNLPPDTTVTIRTLLTNHLDLMSIPRRSFFAQLAHFTHDPFHRDRLLEFTNPEYIDELYDYTTRPRRSILEVLQEFESVKIPWQRVCSVIPVLRGRQFGIASAMASATEAGQEITKVELLVAIVKYRTVIKKIREGVCTRYISSLRPGQKLTITLQKGGLGVTKSELGRPVVMIGPGTGVAPMRALIYQRKQWSEEESQAVAAKLERCRDMLFFGCRNEGSDYFFKDEWVKLRREGIPLDVFAAFSRDQRQKVYVQDLLRQHGNRIHDALVNHDAIVYLCGASGKMPQAVREALIEVCSKEGNMEREAAEAYLVSMEKTGRYKQETW